MLDKLFAIKKRWEDVEQQLSDPKTLSDMKLFAKLNKEYKDLKEVVDMYHVYKNVLGNIESAKEVMANEKDEEFKEMAKIEFEENSEKKEKLEEEIRMMLVPKDPEDSKNVVMEIRAGTGGDEASIFAGDLYRMYSRYIENCGWKAELVDFQEGTAGGYKEVILNVSGDNVFGKLKYESGVHRVQRVPQTETQGRVHTSAASVIVMPEADELDVDVKENDIRKDTFCSSGPGGQSVNTTKSAIRLTHIPTGIVVQCQDQKSQLKNYDKALAVLRSRIYEIEYQKRVDEASKKRKTMVSTGDRSEKIRTYNYPQSRVTDHRIGLSTHNLPDFMNGNIDSFIEGLQIAENSEKMKEGGVLI
ncbi:MAG: peptide chain release factor 1 [Bacteroidetes bacterium]|nr:peptide chain release factor 1 [Bacteroidota bacterium]HRH01391.1 peptide chain release factor 1 [Bacteroidia bacterium]HRH07502.1 peptide chain release factor 1 [Bacteroidia bacterium]HRH61976.1 peptide chain release factor 1 [Bacteroidia bacterium]